MSTPPEPDDAPTPSADHPTADHPTAEQPSVQEPSGRQPVSPTYVHPPAAYAYPPPYAHPFAPTVREPWVNPSKKRTVGLLAAAAAVVLLGAGFAAGVAAGDGHDHRDGHERAFTVPVGDRNGMVPGMGRRQHHPGQLPGHRSRHPNGKPLPPPGRTVTPSPAPSASPSSSHR